MLTRIAGARAAFSGAAPVMGPWLIDRPILCSSWVTSLQSPLERRKWEWNYNTNHVTSSGDRRKENTIRVPIKHTQTHTHYTDTQCCNFHLASLWCRKTHVHAHTTQTHTHVSSVFTCCYSGLYLSLKWHPTWWFSSQNGWKATRLWTCSHCITALVLFLPAAPLEKGGTGIKQTWTDFFL